MAGVSVIGGVAAAWRFLAPAWRRAWAALALTSLGLGLWFAARVGAAPAVWRTPALAAALAGAVMVQGALYRTPARAGAAPGGLQWTRVELRLTAVWALIGVLWLILGSLAFTAIIGAAYAAASAGAGFVAADPATWGPAVDAWGRIVVGAVAAAGGLGLLWVLARVGLAPAATVARGRVQVLSSWPLTRRAGWRIALAMTLTAVAPAALWLAFGRLPLGPTPWPASFAGGLAIGGLWLPLNVGLMRYLHARVTTT